MGIKVGSPSLHSEIDVISISAFGVKFSVSLSDCWLVVAAEVGFLCISKESEYLVVVEDLSEERAAVIKFGLKPYHHTHYYCLQVGYALLLAWPTGDKHLFIACLLTIEDATALFAPGTSSATILRPRLLFFAVGFACVARRSAEPNENTMSYLH